MSDWAQRTAVITGAASGIGRAAVKRVLEQGGRVVAVDLERADMSWIAPLDRDGTRTRIVKGDVTVEATNAAAVEAAAGLGGLNAVFLNAGLAASGTLETIDMATFDRVLAVNLRAVVLGVRAALPALRKADKPAVVVTASVSGLGGDPGLWAYNTAKGGVANFVRAAALELGREGIRINAVCPGPTHTGMTADIRQSPVYDDAPPHSARPLGRTGRNRRGDHVPRFHRSLIRQRRNGAGGRRRVRRNRAIHGVKRLSFGSRRLWVRIGSCTLEPSMGARPATSLSPDGTHQHIPTAASDRVSTA